MIELNLTYEESKKILELGYDFSSVCATFSASGKTSSHGLPFATMITNPFLKEVGHLENLNHLKSLPYMRLDKEINIDSIIPIIPKAALEACLPTSGDGIGDEKSSFYWYKQLQGGDCHERISYVFNFDHFGDYSIYEAFLWCHENYPEELKKKFNEVVG